MAEINFFGYKFRFKLIDTLLLIVVLFLCLSAGTQWGYAYRFRACEVMCLLGLVRIGYEKKAVISGWKIYFAVFILFLLFSYFRSYNPEGTWRFMIIYLGIFLFSLNDMEENFWDKFLQIMEVVCIVVAISVIISAASPQIFAHLGKFIMGGSKAVEVFMKRAASRQYAGLATEIAEAACLMNYGLALVWARGFQTQFQRKDAVIIVLYYVALMLTTKRTLFVIAVAIPLLMVLLVKRGIENRIRYILAFLVLALVMLVIVSAVPSLQFLFERFSELESDENMGGRAVLWMYSMDMFNDEKLLGYGYGAYNKYVNDRGFQHLGGDWTAYGHNIYLESLAENGIIGTILIFIPIIISIIVGVYHVLKDNLEIKNKIKVQFFLYIDIMFALYGYTGNCLVYIQQIYLWVLSIIGIFYFTKSKMNIEDEV